MRIPQYVVASLVVVFGTCLLLAQDVKQPTESFTVSCELTHATDRTVANTVVVAAGVDTDIPIRQSHQNPDGLTVGYSGRTRLYVPSLALMADAAPEKGSEMIDVGPRLTCRVNRLPNGQLLLDVTLTETQPQKIDLKAGLLAATTRQVRFVQPIAMNQSVDLNWPAGDDGKVSRSVTLSIVP